MKTIYHNPSHDPNDVCRPKIWVGAYTTLKVKKLRVEDDKNVLGHGTRFSVVVGEQSKELYQQIKDAGFVKQCNAYYSMWNVRTGENRTR